METRKNLYSYVPEPRFFSEKTAAARKCDETFAVLDTSDGVRLVAGKGKRLGAFARFSSVDSLPSEALPAPLFGEAPPALLCLPEPDGVTFFFPHLVRETGLLLALSFAAPPRERQRAAEFAKRYAKSAPCNAFLREKTIEELLLPDGDSSVFGHIRGTVCLLLTLLEERQESFRTLIYIAAHCAGCRIDRMVLPDFSGETGLDSADRKRLIAFLLCVFLSMRTSDGEVSASRPSGDGFLLTIEQTDPASDASLRKVSSRKTPLAPPPAIPVSALFRTSDPQHEDAASGGNRSPAEGTGGTPERFPFLSLPCFRTFVFDTPNGVSFRARLHGTTATRHLSSGTFPDAYADARGEKCYVITFLPLASS